MSAPVLAWYFSDESRALRFGDGRKIEIGCTHEVGTPIIMCERGLHASVKILDALGYAHGPVVYRVELSGEMVVKKDKIAAQKRRYLSGGIDVSDVLRSFARKQALSAARLWDMPTVVRQYLETGDNLLRAAASSAARAAARDAARAAARDAASSAARAAARDAAWDAAWDAARAAAWGAASSAARDAAMDAAWGAAEEMLASMIEEAISESEKTRKEEA